MITLPGNPYNVIGAQHAAGLASIEAGLTTGMSVNDLVSQVTSYVCPIYSICSDPLTATESAALVPNAATAYINQEMEGFSAVQTTFMNLLQNGILGVPIESIGDYILDVQNNIFKSCNNLSFQDRVPLSVATTVATAGYNYWMAAVNNGSSNWYTKGYFNANDFVNYKQIPNVLRATIQATMWGGNKASTYGQMDPPQIIGVDLVSALTSSIGVASGKVMFNWMPMLQQC